jgi:hypothetical protein
MKINTDKIQDTPCFAPNRFASRGKKQIEVERRKKAKELRKFRHEKRMERYIVNGQKKALAKAAVAAVLRKAKAERHQKMMERHESRFKKARKSNDCNESSLPVGSDRG